MLLFLRILHKREYCGRIICNYIIPDWPWVRPRERHIVSSCYTPFKLNIIFSFFFLPTSLSKPQWNNFHTSEVQRKLGGLPPNSKDKFTYLLHNQLCTPSLHQSLGRQRFHCFHWGKCLWWWRRGSPSRWWQHSLLSGILYIGSRLGYGISQDWSLWQVKWRRSALPVLIIEI